MVFIFNDCVVWGTGSIREFYLPFVCSIRCVLEPGMILYGSVKGKNLGDPLTFKNYLNFEHSRDTTAVGTRGDRRTRQCAAENLLHNSSK